jgi:hypothetical protein
MRLVFHGDGVLSQFEGYEALTPGAPTTPHWPGWPTPGSWPGRTALRLFVRYRGQSLEIELDGDAVLVNARHCCAPSIRIGVNGQVHDLAPSERRRFALR